MRPPGEKKKPKRFVKKGVLIGMLLAFLSGGIFVVQLRNGAQEVAYETRRVERGKITATVSATGTVNAVTTVKVGTQVSGIIEKLFADFNSIVQAGEIIARLDQRTFQAKRAQAQANLESAQAEVKVAAANLRNMEAALENAQAEVASARANLEKARVAVIEAERALRRNRELAGKNLISRSELESIQAAYDSAGAQQKAAQAQLEAAQAKFRSAQAQKEVAAAQVDKAKAQVSQAKAALQQAEVDLEHTLIRAPVNGVVISRDVDVGQTVAASLQAPVLFTIAQDLTKMQVDANVDEADIGKIVVGQTAVFTVDAYPGETFKGIVKEIRLAPIIEQNVVHYDTVIRVENPAQKLRPGMTATVTLIVAERENSLKIPNAALRFHPEREETGRQEGRNTLQSFIQLQRTPSGRVWVVDGSGRPAAVSLRLGITDGLFTEILEGDLQEGAEVIVGYQEKEGGNERRRPRQPRLRF